MTESVGCATMPDFREVKKGFCVVRVCLEQPLWKQFLSRIWEQRFEWNGEGEFRDCSMLGRVLEMGGGEGIFA